MCFAEKTGGGRTRKATVIVSASIITTSAAYGADPRDPSIFNANPGSYGTQQKNVFAAICSATQLKIADVSLKDAHEF